MSFVRIPRPWPVVAGAALALVLAAVLAGIAGGKRTEPPAEPAQPAPAPDTVIVRDTRANLQQAFANEMNGKERYAAAARQADSEGYPAVAALFRACARAEEASSDRHVSAIAAIGDEAKVVLERLPVGSTIENLQASIAHETHEASRYYPAFIARARAQRASPAVRSMNLALAADREHVRLLEAALASLEQRPPPHAYFVCPFCGKTVESLDFRKCPTCFTAARKFVRVI